MSLWMKLLIGAAAMVVVLNIISFLIEESKPIPALIQIKEVSGRTESDVAKILGKGKFEEKWKNERAGCTVCPKYSYQDGKYEVIFINDVADRITVNNLDNYDYKDKIIMGLLGLSDTTPTTQTNLVKRWNSYEGFREIMAFNKNGKVDYVVVLSKAE